MNFNDPKESKQKTEKLYAKIQGVNQIDYSLFWADQGLTTRCQSKTIKHDLHVQRSHIKYQETFLTVDEFLDLPENQDEPVSNQLIKSQEQHDQGEQNHEDQEILNPEVEREPKKKKNDQKKNMYGNIYKYVVRQIPSPLYKDIVQKLMQKYKIVEEQAKQFFKHVKRIAPYTFSSLRSVVDQLNQEKATNPVQKRWTKCIKKFFVWILRNKYSIYVCTLNKKNRIREDYKIQYMQTKNELLCALGKQNQKIVQKK